MHATNTHEGHFVEHTGTIALRAAPDKVFPLFGHDREREWADDWTPEPVYPDVVVAQEGAVFRTRHGGDAVWVVNRYDASTSNVAYTNFRHEDRVTRIWISVDDDPERKGWSVANVTYAITALSEKGAHYIAHFDEAHYQAMMQEWEEDINASLSKASYLNLDNRQS
ncbi:MAG: hypothetical protein ABIQ44_14955 [Chloroflexia bacterium]